MLLKKLLFPTICLLIVPVYFLGVRNLRNPAITFLFVKYVAGFLVITSIMMIVQVLREHFKNRPSQAEKFNLWDNIVKYQRELIFVGLMVLYLVFFYSVGFVVLSGVVFTIFMKVLGGSWRKSIVTSWVLAITVFLVFVKFFTVRLPWGILAPLEFYIY